MIECGIADALKWFLKWYATSFFLHSRGKNYSALCLIVKQIFIKKTSQPILSKLFARYFCFVHTFFGNFELPFIWRGNMNRNKLSFPVQRIYTGSLPAWFGEWYINYNVDASGNISWLKQSRSYGWRLPSARKTSLAFVMSCKSF